MAEEVGQAYVSLIPSARNLSRMIKEELRRALRGIKGEGIEVPVEPKLDPMTGALRTELQRQANALTKKIALELPVGVDSSKARDRLQGQLAAVTEALKLAVPTEPGGLADYQNKLRSMIDSTKVVQKIKFQHDVDNDSLENQAAKAGSTFGDLFLRGFGSGLLNPVVGIPALIAAALAAVLAGPVVAGAVVLGGGLAAIVLGAFGLKADEQLKTALTGLKETAKTVLADAAQPLKGPFLEAIGIISNAIKELSPDLKAMFTQIAPVIPEIARGLAGFFKSLKETGALDKFSDAMVPILQQFAMFLPDLGNAISQFLISMKEAHAAEAFGGALRTLADIIRFVGGAISWLSNQFDKVMFAIKAVGTVIGWIVDGFGVWWRAIFGDEEARQVIYDMADGIHNFAVGVRRWLEDLWSYLGMVAGTVVSTITGLPAQILGAVTGFGSLLYNAGRNVVQGLIDGIRSMLSNLGNMAGEMAGTVRRYLPFSPAKEGPLSGSGNPYHSGQVIAGDLAAGVRSQLPAVASAADQLAGQFGAGGVPAVGSTASGGGRLTAEWVDSATGDPVLDTLRELIRIRYNGDVNRALGAAA